MELGRFLLRLSAYGAVPKQPCCERIEELKEPVAGAPKWLQATSLDR